MTGATLEQATNEYMSLAPTIGVIPEKYRNRGYDKLEFEPGEGGIGAVLAAAPTAPAAPAPSGITMEAFLAGIAAGADPAEYAKQLLGDAASAEPTPDPPRGRRRTPAAATE